jgi:hypothetical protein
MSLLVSLVSYLVRCVSRNSAVGKAFVSPAGRRLATPLSRERHEPLERARVAPHLREAAGEDPARQELAELLLDELRQAWANGAARRASARNVSR